MGFGLELKIAYYLGPQLPYGHSLEADHVIRRSPPPAVFESPSFARLERVCSTVWTTEVKGKGLHSRKRAERVRHDTGRVFEFATTMLVGVRKPGSHRLGSSGPCSSPPRCFRRHFIQYLDLHPVHVAANRRPHPKCHRPKLLTRTKWMRWLRSHHGLSNLLQGALLRRHFSSGFLWFDFDARER